MRLAPRLVLRVALPSALAALGLLAGPGAARADEAAALPSASSEAPVAPAPAPARPAERPPTRSSYGLPSAALPTFPAGRSDVFVLESGSHRAWLRFGATVQADGRFYLEEGDGRPLPQASGGPASAFLLRRVRPTLAGAFGQYATFRLMPDFAGGQLQLFDAYFDLGPDAVRLMLGKMKSPFGLERLQNAASLPLIERGLPNELSPNRDVGVQIHGEPLGGSLRYAVGVFDGAPDGQNVDTDIDDKKDLAGHLFVQPFWSLGRSPLRRLGLGVAGTRGKRTGTPKTPLVGSYRAPSQAAFFRYRSDEAATAQGTVVAHGTSQRATAHGFWFWGRAGAVGEYVISDQAVEIGQAHTTLRSRAMQGTLQLALTDDELSFDGLLPSRPFGRGAGLGAVMLAARYGELRVDPRAFPTYADPKKNPERARSLEAGATWVLDSHMKVEADYATTLYDGHDGQPLPQRAEKVLMTRFQGRF